MKPIFIILSLLFTSFTSPNLYTPPLLQSDNLIISKITDNTYLHVSYLETEEFGRVPCNGMIYIHNGQVLIFDTPATPAATKELIDWVGQEIQGTIKGVVVTHFHEDCLGGLEAFHKEGIPSYAHNLTIELARQKGYTLPQTGFTSQLTIYLDDQAVINFYPGEGHTRDNIVSYIPSGKVLFGGCLIKADGAGKGNLADANVEEWPNTVRNVQSTFPDVEHVVPGHGETGGVELLGYTIELFKQ